MSVTIAGRTHEGLEIPAPGTWTIDPSHSSVSFIARHLMVAKVRGLFARFDGTVHIAEKPEDSWAEVNIDAASIDTRDEKRDAHLRSGDFFDVENHPTITFRSTGFRRTSGTRFELPGDLTIRGVTRAVTLQAELEGLAPDPLGNTRAAFTARTEIDREDFGLTWNQALETGGVLVGPRVKIELEVTAVHQASS